jgi:cell wall-associated NlpC family hydrolase
MRAAVIAALLALAVGGCGGQQGAASSGPRTTTAAAAAAASTTPKPHPQAIDPLAGQQPQVAAPGAQAGVSVGPTSGSLPQPATTAMIEQELRKSGLTASTNQATLTHDGLAIAPLGAPPAVQDVIAAANEIARLPYRYGGGHVTYADTAYDCSGSISFVFEAAHLLPSSVVSGQLENWGAAGPGKWITVFANSGHTFMYVAGLRFDTVALAETGSRWSDRSATEPDLKTFSIRHPPGL